MKIKNRISYTRLRCHVESPFAGDMLTRFSDHKFVEAEKPALNTVEYGWNGGDHLFDGEFSSEKNTVNRSVLVSARFDAHKAPAAVRKGLIGLHEKALSKDNPSGFASKDQKTEAIRLATDQLKTMAAQGKFRRCGLVPLIWHLPSAEIYVCTNSAKQVEVVHSLLSSVTGLDFSVLSAGLIAEGERSVGDVMPTAFTPAPDGDTNACPEVPWSGKGLSSKDFLGNEFLLWLWYLMDTKGGTVSVLTGDQEEEIHIALCNSLVMECSWGQGGRCHISDDNPTNTTEAKHGLILGKLPRRSGIIVSNGSTQWECTFRADDFQFSGLQLGDSPDAATHYDVLSYQIDSVREFDSLMRKAFREFLTLRTSEAWTVEASNMKTWIEEMA